MLITAGELAALVEGDLDGDPGVAVTGVAPLDAATADTLVFAADRARLAELAESGCGAALVPTPLLRAARDVVGVPLIAVDDPRAAVARVLDRLYPPVPTVEGVHPAATVAESAVLADGVGVAAGAVVDERARLGARTSIGSGAYVGRGVEIGEACVVHPNVTLYDGTRMGDRVVVHAGVVIGADGFGFARDESEGQLKIPQVGGVRIGDDVEIGANACVDRGTLGDTVIGAGSKIDNLVQIGHNCRVGRNCALSGLTGLAGSTVLEDGVIMGGNAGTAGHQVIGANSMIAGKAGVHGDLEPGSVVAGNPHMDISIWRRMVGTRAKLPDMLRRLRRLERRVDAQSEE